MNRVSICFTSLAVLFLLSACITIKDADKYDMTGDDMMETASASETVPETVPAPETVPETSSTPETESEATVQVSNGIRPEFKEAMDAYEAFYKDYCDFMKSIVKTRRI